VAQKFRPAACRQSFEREMVLPSSVVMEKSGALSPTSTIFSENESLMTNRKPANARINRRIRSVSCFFASEDT